MFTDKTGDFGAIFVTERNCSTPISKLKSRIGVHTVIPSKSVCPITAQFCSVVRRSLSTVSSVFPVLSIEYCCLEVLYLTSIRIERFQKAIRSGATHNIVSMQTGMLKAPTKIEPRERKTLHCKLECLGRI